MPSLDQEERSTHASKEKGRPRRIGAHRPGEVSPGLLPWPHTLGPRYAFLRDCPLHQTWDRHAQISLSSGHLHFVRKLLRRIRFPLNTFVCVSPVNLCQFNVQTQSGTLRGSRKAFSSTAVKETRSPGRGNGTPLQYSCLEHLMDRGAWWATVQGVTRVRHDWAEHSTVEETKTVLCQPDFRLLSN